MPVLVLALNGAIECLNREVPRSDLAQVQAQAPLTISNTPSDVLSTRLDNALTYTKTPNSYLRPFHTGWYVSLVFHRAFLSGKEDITLSKFCYYAFIRAF